MVAYETITTPLISTVSSSSGTLSAQEQYAVTYSAGEGAVWRATITMMLAIR